MVTVTFGAFACGAPSGLGSAPSASVTGGVWAAGRFFTDFFACEPKSCFCALATPFVISPFARRCAMAWGNA
eukprot:5886942-Pyramimonas_sp.AAC.1